MTKQIDVEVWRDYVSHLEIRPLFVTVSGAHLYGFPSPDSDVDLRGCHQLPLESIVGLGQPNETRQTMNVHRGIEVDLVSHDIRKYFGLMVQNNGYILEQIFSPLVICGQPFLDQLRPLAAGCVTKNCYHHYRGFYATQRKMIDRSERITAKSLLYAYRVLLTGIHMMRTGWVEPNLLRLNQEFALSGISELIDSKVTEKATPDIDREFHVERLDQLEIQMQEAFESSTLREKADRRPVNDFLIQLRTSSC